MLEKGWWCGETKGDTLSGSQDTALWKQTTLPEAVFLRSQTENGSEDTLTGLRTKRNSAN